MPAPIATRRRTAGRVACALAAFVTANAAADGLPEPLTLEEALALAEAPHPSIEESRALLAAAEAEREQVAADDDFYANLELNASYVEPANIAYDQSNNDSKAVLSLRKQLYDFGQTRDSVAAADAAVRGSEWQYLDRLQRRRVEIMQAYFNVLLADLSFARENEAMATAYVDMDRAHDRNELGQVSDIEVLRLEDAYQEVRMRRYRAQTAQRTERAKLAQILNSPGQLPATLIPPELPANDTEVPPYERLIEQALAANPTLLALRENLDATRLALEASRKQRRPVLSTEVEVAEYEREMGSYEPFRASLILDIPLFQGGRVDASVAKQRAEMSRLQARVGQFELDLRQAVLEAWQEVQTLQAQREQAWARVDYRDLYLDRSRAEYELEIKTDLGDAMVEQTAARLLQARTEYSLALAWARLAALTGATDFSPLRPPAENPLTALGNSSETEATP